MGPESHEIMKEVFAGLVKKAHEEAEKETAERIKGNPLPTEEELRVGAFREMIEPQVMDAVFEMHRKGYSTESSWFHDGDPSLQFISGFFKLKNSVIEALRKSGIQAEEIFPFKKGHTQTILSFRAKEPDLIKIKEQWAEAAELLPDKSESAEPAALPMAQEFREKLVPAGSDILS